MRKQAKEAEKPINNAFAEAFKNLDLPKEIPGSGNGKQGESSFYKTDFRRGDREFPSQNPHKASISGRFKRRRRQVIQTVLMLWIRAAAVGTAITSEHQHSTIFTSKVPLIFPFMGNCERDFRIEKKQNIQELLADRIHRRYVMRDPCDSENLPEKQRV